MSGTSLDGLDLAACKFWQEKRKWHFEILSATTKGYTGMLRQKLATAHTLNSEQLIALHNEYGRFIGNEIREFMRENRIEAELIASHGHTVFHQPEKGFTFQAGNGAAIAAITGIKTVSGFRQADVALGGQGAPLVPAGDRLLFGKYKYCLNLGGFANISFEHENFRIAYDICPVNIVLNYFAEKKGHAFDSGGRLGEQGNVDQGLLEELNSISYYRLKPPKSLGREWVDENFLPLVENRKLNFHNTLRTIYEHIAVQIGKTFLPPGEGLVTGGGAFNTFLMERIKHYSGVRLVIPEKVIVSCKEALIFAFLGLLRERGEINCLSSVTGAKKDSCCGIIHLP